MKNKSTNTRMHVKSKIKKKDETQWGKRRTEKLRERERKAAAVTKQTKH